MKLYGLPFIPDQPSYVRASSNGISTINARLVGPGKMQEIATWEPDWTDTRRLHVPTLSSWVVEHYVIWSERWRFERVGNKAFALHFVAGPLTIVRHDRWCFVRCYGCGWEGNVRTWGQRHHISSEQARHRCPELFDRYQRPWRQPIFVADPRAEVGA